MLMKGWSFAFCFAFGFEITFEEISAIPVAQHDTWRQV